MSKRTFTTWQIILLEYEDKYNYNGTSWLYGYSVSIKPGNVATSIMSTSLSYITAYSNSANYNGAGW